jgi:hypothetical protein
MEKGWHILKGTQVIKCSVHVEWDKTGWLQKKAAARLSTCGRKQPGSDWGREADLWADIKHVIFVY